MCKTLAQAFDVWLNLFVTMWVDIASVAQSFRERERFRASMKKQGIYMN